MVLRAVPGALLLPRAFSPLRAQGCERGAGLPAAAGKRGSRTVLFLGSSLLADELSLPAASCSWRPNRAPRGARNAAGLRALAGGGEGGVPSAPRCCFHWGCMPWCSAPPGQLCSDMAPVPALPGRLCHRGCSLLPTLGQIPANGCCGWLVWKLQEAPEEGMWCKGEKRRRRAGKLLCGTSPSLGTATAQAEVSSPLTRALAAEQRSPRRGGAGGAAKGHAGSAAGAKRGINGGATRGAQPPHPRAGVALQSSCPAVFVPGCTELRLFLRREIPFAGQGHRDLVLGAGLSRGQASSVLWASPCMGFVGFLGPSPSPKESTELPPPTMCVPSQPRARDVALARYFSSLPLPS